MNVKAKNKVFDNFVNMLTFDDIEELLHSFLQSHDTSLVSSIIEQKTIVIWNDYVDITFKVNNKLCSIKISNFHVVSSIFNKDMESFANYKLRCFMLEKTKKIDENIARNYRLKLYQIVNQEVENEILEKEKNLMETLENQFSL